MNSQELERLNDNIDTIFDALRKNTKAFDDRVEHVNQAFDEIQKRINAELVGIAERIRAVEGRLDDLIDSDRWSGKEIETLSREYHTLKKYVLGTDKHDFENTLFYQAKEANQLSVTNAAQIERITNEIKNLTDFFRYIGVVLFVVCILTATNGALIFTFWFR